MPLPPDCTYAGICRNFLKTIISPTRALCWFGDENIYKSHLVLSSVVHFKQFMLSYSLRALLSEGQSLGFPQKPF